MDDAKAHESAASYRSKAGIRHFAVWAKCQERISSQNATSSVYLADVPSELSDWSSSSSSSEDGTKECELRIVEGDESEMAGGQEASATPAAAAPSLGMATTAPWASPSHRKAHAARSDKPR